jgi:hypothetical protein
MQSFPKLKHYKKQFQKTATNHKNSLLRRQNNLHQHLSIYKKNNHQAPYNDKKQGGADLSSGAQSLPTLKHYKIQYQKKPVYFHRQA